MHTIIIIAVSTVAILTAYFFGKVVGGSVMIHRCTQAGLIEQYGKTLYWTAGKHKNWPVFHTKYNLSHMSYDDSLEEDEK